VKVGQADVCATSNRQPIDSNNGNLWKSPERKATTKKKSNFIENNSNNNTNKDQDWNSSKYFVESFGNSTMQEKN
jgi:hypothetical protein